ncbi:MAG: flagellar basal-body MS-ring/collar protein FliF [Bacillota bacterium]
MLCPAQGEGVLALAEESSGQSPYNAAESRLGSLWKNLNKPARSGIIAIGVITALVIIWLAGTSLIPSPMEVLFHRLDPLQAQKVVQKLDESGITYRLADDGTTIMVPRDQRDRLRLTLSPDLYAQGAGFALFENNGLVASDFERRVQWQVALEEELRRTITSIEAVEQARVHLVIPEGSLFLRERGTPSASVFLRMGPLASLSEAQVRGILSLVAGSVEGLLPENVTIVDSSGNILFDAFSAMGGATVSGAVEDQLKLKRQFERELENRLRAVLEQVYGPGSALAMVSAELDFDTRETTVITYDDEPVSRSTHLVEEHSEGTGVTAGETGEPNIPGYDGIAGGSGDYSYERIEEIVNYEISETREYIAAAPGQVMRLSTAIVIDRPTVSPAVAEQVSALVTSALGLDKARGDTVNVQMLPFETTWREGWDDAPVETVLSIYYYWAAGLVLLLVLLLGIILLSRLARSRRRAEEKLIGENTPVMEKPVETPLTEEEKWHKQVRRLADEEPAGVASLIKTWLVEE